MTLLRDSRPLGSIIPATLLTALIVVGVILLAGCSASRPAPIYGWNWTGPAPEGYYLVQRGDSLSVVAEKHALSTRTLAKWNRIKSPYTIYADTLLRIVPPDGKSAKAVRPAASRAVVSSTATRSSRPSVANNSVNARPARTPKPTKVTRKPTKVASKPTKTAPKPRIVPETPGSRRTPSGVMWQWPLQGALAQTFRSGDRTRQGIRIAGRAGEQVGAAAPGVIVYAGSGLKGYGNLIIVKHNNKYLSAYGFNRRLLASEGDSVGAGQPIAEVGQGAEGNHLLHFEVRRHGTAVDPILYLPARN